MENQYPDRIVHLLQLYLLGDITKEERQELEVWCEEKVRNRQLFEQICQEDLFSKERFVYEKIDDTKALRTFEKHVRKVSARGIGRWWKYAAVLLFPILVVGSWKLIYEVEQVPVVTTSVSQIQPGCSRAVLVLDDGRKVFLKEEDERVISEDKGITVTGEKDRLVYTSSEGKNVDEIRFNELEVPRGGEYKVRLADGTLVYLNSATRMKYPVKFDEKERKVYLSGEAYFEVHHDPAHPFYVKTKSLDVKVLGTSFNVKAYNNMEVVETSLVEGLVSVKDNVLRPNMQAVFHKNTGDFSYRKINGESYRLRKERVFVFDEERLDDILQEMARWYDFEIFYQNPEMADKRFGFKLEKYEHVDTLLDILELTGEVRFTMKGKTLTVMSGT